jgi:ribosomal protein S18 acetylase RimI-like enzyme
MLIRPAVGEADRETVWSIIAPIIAEGETYALPRDWSRAEALAYWFVPDNEVFLAEAEGAALGACYIKPNKLGGGAHVANAGFATAVAARGRGVARAMGEHILAHARERGFRAMQFNFVVSSNAPAVRLWTSLGFETLCRVPEAFAHPILGYVDALVMYRRL